MNLPSLATMWLFNVDRYKPNVVMGLLIDVSCGGAWAVSRHYVSINLHLPAPTRMMVPSFWLEVAVDPG